MLINLGTEEKPMYVEPTAVVCVCKYNPLRGEECTSITTLGGDECHVSTPVADVVKKVNSAKIEHERQAFWDMCCAATIQSDEDEDEVDYCARIAWLKLQERNEVTGFKVP